MHIKYILVIAFSLLSATIRAQQIEPVDLFQVYKYWQMDTQGYDKNTYDYIQSMDKNWRLRIAPQSDQNSLLLLLGYYKNNSWYQDEECRIMLSYDQKERSPKGVMYLFTDINIWEKYKTQMAKMNAVYLKSDKSQGGNQTVYQVNDILIFLTDFPPGINGINRTYQVLLTHQVN